MRAETNARRVSSPSKEQVIDMEERYVKRVTEYNELADKTLDISVPMPTPTPASKFG
jgi:hypothetical protein